MPAVTLTSAPASRFSRLSIAEPHHPRTRHSCAPSGALSIRARPALPAALRRRPCRAAPLRSATRHVAARRQGSGPAPARRLGLRAGEGGQFNALLEGLDPREPGVRLRAGAVSRRSPRSI